MMPRMYCGAFWTVQGFGRADQQVVCHLKPGHDRYDPEEPATELERAHRATFYDSDDNPITDRPPAGVAVHQVHMAATVQVGRDLDLWQAQCNCGWVGVVELKQEVARTLGDDHLELYNGLIRS
jgi:hypothetical protein